MKIIPKISGHVQLDLLKEVIQQKILDEFEKKHLELVQNKKVVKNGYYKKRFNTELGSIVIDVPRFRNEKFDCDYISVSSYSQNIIELILRIYGHGLSTSRISNTLDVVFDINMSKQTISNHCKLLNYQVNDHLAKSYLEEEFVAIYVDGKYFSVREMRTKNKVPLMTAIGRTKSGKLINIHLEVIYREGFNHLQAFLLNLQKKIGMTKAVFVVDGNNFMSSCIKSVFPESKTQQCLVHIVRNIKKKLSKICNAKTQNLIEKMLNELFFVEDNQNFELRLREIFSKYPSLANTIRKLLRNKTIFTFLNYKNDFAKLIKINNTIEQFHSNLEAVTKQHRTYKNKDSLYRAIIQEVLRFEKTTDSCPDTTKSTINFAKIDDCIKYCKDNNMLVLKIISNGIEKINTEISSKQLEDIHSIITIE